MSSEFNLPKWSIIAGVITAATILLSGTIALWFSFRNRPRVETAARSVRSETPPPTATSAKALPEKSENNIEKTEMPAAIARPEPPRPTPAVPASVTPPASTGAASPPAPSGLEAAKIARQKAAAKQEAAARAMAERLRAEQETTAAERAQQAAARQKQDLIARLPDQVELPGCEGITADSQPAPAHLVNADWYNEGRCGLSLEGDMQNFGEKARCRLTKVGSAARWRCELTGLPGGDESEPVAEFSVGAGWLSFAWLKAFPAGSPIGQLRNCSLKIDADGIEKRILLRKTVVDAKEAIDLHMLNDAENRLTPRRKTLVFPDIPAHTPLVVRICGLEGLSPTTVVHDAEADSVNLAYTDSDDAPRGDASGKYRKPLHVRLMAATDRTATPPRTALTVAAGIACHDWPEPLLRNSLGRRFEAEIRALTDPAAPEELRLTPKFIEKQVIPPLNLMSKQIAQQRNAGMTKGGTASPTGGASSVRRPSKSHSKRSPSRVAGGTGAGAASAPVEPDEAAAGAADTEYNDIRLQLHHASALSQLLREVLGSKSGVRLHYSVEMAAGGDTRCLFTTAAGGKNFTPVGKSE